MYHFKDDEGITIGLILPSVNPPTPHMGVLQKVTGFKVPRMGDLGG
jgi:hypothetical protein